jgi:hypothetical protein
LALAENNCIIRGDAKVIFFRRKGRRGRKHIVRDPKTGKFLPNPPEIKKAKADPKTKAKVEAKAKEREDPEPAKRHHFPIKLPFRLRRTQEDNKESPAKKAVKEASIPLEKVRGIIWYSEGEPL